MDTKNISIFAVVVVVCLTAVVGLGALISSKTSVNHSVVVESPQMNVEPVNVNVEAPQSSEVAREEKLGGWVHNVQEIFSAGIKAGTSETEVINSSGQWVGVFNGTTITASGESNLARMIQGGSVLGVNTASTTLTAANCCDNTVIWHEATSTSDQPVNTMTLPATTTLYADCLTANGDFVSLLYYNATSSYGASTTFAEGVGVELLISSDTGGSATVLPTERARIIITRVSSVTSTAEVQVLADGD